MPDLAGTVLEGKYELIRLLGEGGMGAVYEARHRLIGRRLAVKFLHSHYVTSEEVLTRFQREAQAAAAIGHENIIDVTDMGQTPDGAPFLVMEYLDGVDLRELLAEAGVLSVEQTAHIMTQALSALQSAHDAGIIHRDLKPENIYLIEKSDRKNYVKLLDFGISKFKTLEGEGAKGLTQTGTVLGTPYYMSPEQARGDQNIGPKSDIYAMGVILFQMLTGKLPFDAPNYNALLIKILTEDPPDPLSLSPELPLDIVDTIKIAMARDTADRFEDCTEFRRRIAPYVPGSSGAYQTKMTSASRSAIRAALSSNTTPLDMTRSGGVAPAKKRLPLVLGISSGLVAAAAAAVYFFMIEPGDKGPAAEPIAVPASVAPAAASPAVGAPTKPSEPVNADKAQPADTEPEKVRLKVYAKPEKARISIDGAAVDGNPYEQELDKDDAVHTIEIAADGYEPISAEVKFDQDQELAYTLSKESRKPHRSARSNRRTRDRDKPVVTEKPVDKPTAASDKPRTPRSTRRRIDDEDPWN